MSIQLEWREVEPGNRGFQLAPPQGREYDLWCRESYIETFVDMTNYTPHQIEQWYDWEVVVMPS